MNDKATEPGPKVISLINLNHRDEIGRRIAAEYSRMKYADPKATLAIALKMLSFIKMDPDVAAALSEDKLVLTSSPYGFVPTAAATLTSVIAKYLNREGYHIPIAKIERTGVMGETHYCAMTKEARDEFMKQRKTWIDPQNQQLLKGKLVLAIDDLCASGNHILDMHSLFSQTKARDHKFAIYIRFSVNMAETDAGAESYISRYRIRSTKDLIPHLTLDKKEKLGFCLNARTLKFILQVTPASEYDFNEKKKRRMLVSFIKACSDDLLKQMITAIHSSDDYTQFEKFHEGIEIVHAEIDSRQKAGARISKAVKIIPDAGSYSSQYRPVISTT